MKSGGMLLGMIGSLLWGAMSVIMDQALRLEPLATASLLAAPLAAAAVHDGLAAIWVGGVNAGLRRLRSVPAALFSRSGLVILGAALCGGPLAMGSFVAAISMVGPAYAATVTAVYPAVGALLSRLILKDRLHSRGWVGIAAAVAGAAVASYGSPSGGAHRLLGTLLACVAALGWGAEGVLIAKVVERVKPTVALNLYEVISFVTFVGVVLPMMGATGLAAATVSSWAFPVLIVASLCGAGGYVGYYRSLDLIGAARSMTVFNTYILWTILFSAVVAGAWPDVRLLVGGAVVFLGIWLLASAVEPELQEVEPAEECGGS